MIYISGTSVKETKGILLNPQALVLASTSVYRSALLERLKIPFVTAAPDIDESPLADETALQTSRTTWGELLECEEKTRTNNLQVSMALSIAAAQDVPGVISLGAIQQDIPWSSRLSQTASAAAASLVE